MQMCAGPDNVTYIKGMSSKQAFDSGLQRLHSADSVANNWLEGTAMKPVPQ